MTRTDADRLAFIAAGWGPYGFYFDGDKLMGILGNTPDVTEADLNDARRTAVDRAMSGEDGPYEKRTATK